MVSTESLSHFEGKDDSQLRLYVRNINAEFSRKTTQANWSDGNWGDGWGRGSINHKETYDDNAVLKNLTASDRKAMELIRRLRWRKESASEYLVYDHVTTGVFLANRKFIQILKNMKKGRLENDAFESAKKALKVYFQF